MLTKIAAVAIASYNLIRFVAEDWWQLAIGWGLFGAVCVNVIYLPLKKGEPASAGDLAALFASATALITAHICVHAWKSVNGAQGGQDIA